MGGRALVRNPSQGEVTMSFGDCGRELRDCLNSVIFGILLRKFFVGKRREKGDISGVSLTCLSQEGSSGGITIGGEDRGETLLPRVNSLP